MATNDTDGTNETNETPIELLDRVTDRITSRRDFMSDAALVGGGALALSAVSGVAAANDGDGSASGSEEVSDLDILNYALTLEHLEYAFYEEFLANHSESEVESSAVANYFARPTLQFSVYQQIEDVRDHEQAHVDALTQTIEQLGGTPVGPAEYEFPYETMEEFVALADRLETVGVSAYAGAAPLIDSTEVLKAALSIHSVEAEHQTYFQLLHLQRPAPDAFNMARSMEQVLPIAKQFIVSGDDGDDAEQTEEFHARLSGENEVPPVETDASGHAMFTLADHGEGPHLHYHLSVSNLENVTQGHIHVGGPNENGPVVAFLFGQQDAQGNFVGPLSQSIDKSGTLAEGSITADDLVGPLEGMDLSALAAEIRAGNTYVNFHTTQNPAGEIRGQIMSGTEPAEPQAETEQEPEQEAEPEDDADESAMQSVDSWLADTSNYSGQSTIEDETGQSEESVDVGAPGNGGNFAFSPAAMRVSTGTTVTWEWTGNDPAPHNVVSADGPLDSGAPTADGDAEYQYTFTESGVYLYMCEPHAGLGMKGAIIVE